MIRSGCPGQKRLLAAPARNEAIGERARPHKAIGFGSRGHMPDDLVDNGKLEGRKYSDDTKHNITLEST